MNIRFLWIQQFAVIFALAASICGTLIYADSSAAETTSDNSYFANITIYSINPQKGLSTYRAGSSGGAGTGGTFGTSINCNKQLHNVEFEGRQKAERFLAKLTVTKWNDDKSQKIEVVNRELDLTDLQPLSIEIAREDDGRVYRATIIPSIHVPPLPKAFNVKDLRLEEWGFPDSPVILNDQDYLCSLSMSGGQKAFLDIPGLAKVEFSLLALKDSKPEGVLSLGTLVIRHGETTLKINNVVNGEHHETLQGGPYKVYVRWQPPSQTLEQYRVAVKQQISAIKKRIESGEMDLPASVLSKIEADANTGRITLMSHGTGGIRKDELEEPLP